MSWFSSWFRSEKPVLAQIGKAAARSIVAQIAQKAGNFAECECLGAGVPHTVAIAIGGRVADYINAEALARL